MLDAYIRQHGKRLYGLCRTLCHDKAAADDLYQDTWLKALNNLPRYDPAQPFEPWLTRICVNTYRNGLRRALRSPFAQFTDGEEKQRLLESAPAPAPQDHTELHAAIDRLPEKLRLTVILYYFRDMDVAGTAAVLGVPPGTVKSRLNKARKQLKEWLQNGPDL